MCNQVPLSSISLGLLNTQPKERDYPPSIQCFVACEETSSSPGLLVGIHQAFRSTYSACNGLLVCQWQLHTAVDLQIDGEWRLQMHWATVLLAFQFLANCNKTNMLQKNSTQESHKAYVQAHRLFHSLLKTALGVFSDYGCQNIFLDMLTTYTLLSQCQVEGSHCVFLWPTPL